MSKPARLRAFPQEWFTPTAEAREALCMIAEGFCPFFVTGPGRAQWPLDLEGRCPDCGARWDLVRNRDGEPVGFSATWGQRPYTSLLAAYPFRQDSISGYAVGDIKCWFGYGRPE